MTDSKLQKELLTRTKQLEDMEAMHLDLRQKIEGVGVVTKTLENKISSRTEELQIKSGKLEYILEEKEALFNKLQLALSENKELKKELEMTKKTKKKSLIGSLWGMLKREKYDTIDVSNGKVKKNVDLSKVKDGEKAFSNSRSFITDNPNFDDVDLSGIGKQEENKEDVEEEEESKEEEEEGYEEEEESNEEDDDEEDGEDYDSMLKDIRNSLNTVPK